MTQHLEILVLDMAGGNLLKRIRDFFSDKPAVLKVTADLALFNILAKNKTRYAMAVALVNGRSSHLVKGKYPIPTFVFLPHTYSHRNLRQFYRENGGGDE